MTGNPYIVPIGVFLACVTIGAAYAQTTGAAENEVPGPIKELDVEDALREFQAFERRLEKYRKEVSEGQKTAPEIAAMLDELRRTASPENGHNEKEIIETIGGHVEDVTARQCELVDFL